MRSELHRFFLGFLIALAFASLHLLAPGSDVVPLTGDSATYHRLAEGIERLLKSRELMSGLFTGGIEPAVRESLGIERWEFQHAAGYVFPLGALYALFPANLGVGRALGVILYALSGGLTLIIAGRLLGRRLAWIALAAYLLYLPFLYFGLGIATEGHAAFHVLLVVWLLLRFHRRMGRAEALWCGFGIALLGLAKATYRPLALLLFLGEALWLLREGKRALLARLGAGFCAPLAAWVAALALAGISPSPFGVGSDHALRTFRGNNVADQGWESTGIGDSISRELEEAELAARSAGGDLPWDDASRERVYWGALRRTIARYPVEWMGLVAEKAGLFWQYPARKTFVRTFLGAWPIPRGLHAAFIPLALLGIAAVARRRSAYWVPGAILIAATTMHALTHMVARYHLPLLALGMIFGILGAKSLVVALLRAHRCRAWPGLSMLVWGAGAALAFILGSWLLSPPWACTPAVGKIAYRIGALLQGGAILLLAPPAIAWAGRLYRSRRCRAWALGGAALLCALPVAGTALANRDWDEVAILLTRPGDALVQEIVLPKAAPGERAWAEAWLEIDMLRSLQGSFELDVLVQGERVHAFDDSLEGGYASFLFDPRVHAAEERFRRVAERCRDFVSGWCNPRYGARSPGYDYFRRWVPVPVSLALLDADTIRVELRLVRSVAGAWVKIYGDRYPETPRGFTGPAMGENPYDHSHYRMEFLAGDRERMDSRLTRTRRLAGSSARTLRCRDGGCGQDLDPGWRVLNAEARLRIRCRRPGRLAAGPAPEGMRVPTWTTAAEGEDLDPQSIRRFQAWREYFIDGTQVF